MATALPEGTQIMEWGGLILHALLAGWQDSRLRRVAQHQFDRRAGGANEDMGRAQHQTRVTLLFADAEGLATLRQFVALWDEGPTRLLVHPIYGRMQATFVGIESGELRVDGGANLYTVSGQFVESNIDASTVFAEDDPGSSARAAQVTAASEALSTAASPWSDATSAVEASTAAATTFAGSVTSGLSSALLSSQLASALAAADAAAAAIRAAAQDGPEAASAVAAADILAARLLDLGAAAIARRAALVEYQASEPTALLALAARWYPGEAIARVAEIRANNPDLVGVIVPTGFRLQLAVS